jgi:D-amino-acid dehydrogenase
MKVVVIGGGVVGMFTSYYLLKSGCSVTIVDRQTKALASAYNAGLISPSSTATPSISPWRMMKCISGLSHPITISITEMMQNMSFFYDMLNAGIGSADELIMNLSKESLGLFLKFHEAESVDADVVNGVLVVYNHRADAEAHAKKLRAPLVDSATLEEWGYRGFEGATFHEDEIALNPRKLIQALEAKLRSMGATFLKGSKEARLVKEGNASVSVQVDGERIPAENCIIAAGAWSRQLCKPLGYDIPLLPARGFVILYDTKGSTIVQKPAILEDYGAVFTQHGQNTLRATSYFEMVGFDDKIGQGRMNWLMEVGKKHLSEDHDLRIVETGCGFRPLTSDQIPVVGLIPGYNNAYIATGHARLGLTLAPVTGYLLDAIINKKPVGIDVSALSPSRFMR